MTNTATRQQDRLARMGSVLAEAGVDLLLVAPSADLRYLIGYGAHASERPALLAVMPDAAPLILLPALEAPRLAAVNVVDVVPYSETEDPIARLAGSLPELPAAALVAISDQTWAGVLLRLQRHFPAATFTPASTLLRNLRMRKDAAEIALLTDAGAKADSAFAQLVELRFSGRTERELARELQKLLDSQGLETAQWGPSVASGPNSSSPHHITGNREIHEGDSVVLDFGGQIDGYQADMTRTVHVGTPDHEFVQVYNVVRRAQQAGVEAALVGSTAESVDRATRAIIDEAGYGDYFLHRTGHGVGLEVHEEPYMVHGNGLPLESGMVFSVEPGVYLPGRFGVRVEDIVTTTDDAAVRLNNATRDLVIVH